MNRKRYFTVLVTFFLIAPATLLFSRVSVVNIRSTVNVGQPVNSPVDDFSPSFTMDGKIMVFNSKRGGRYQDIYISYFENNAWSRPVPIREINSRYNDETPYIVPDGGFIFFASDRDGSFEMKADRAGRIRVSYDLYVSKNLGSRWAAPIKIPGTVNTSHHERSPSLSTDLQTLYYTTWPFGDITKSYIVAATYSNGQFINPRPLPAPINNNTQDLGLIPSPGGDGFYFSSLRPGGHGGWDIYYVSYSNGKYGPAVNLGDSINSKGNDLHLTILKDSIYFCSNRQGGLGHYDIYMSKFIMEDRSIQVKVQNKKTKKPLSVDLNISTKITKGDETVTYQKKKRTGKDGEIVIDYKPEAKKLDIVISEKGYLPLFKTLDVEQSVGTKQLLELVPIEKDASFTIHAIYFDYNSARIKPESFPYLNALADYMKANPSFKFEIIGHTDLHGSEKFNLKLSLQRATSVRDYLSARGLDKNRFTLKGAGESRPIVPKTGPGFDEQNRRTEFKLIEK